jgi:hypothetical protein
VVVEDEWVDGDASMGALFRRHVGVHDGRFPGCQRLAADGHCGEGRVEPHRHRVDDATRVPLAKGQQQLIIRVLEGA